ncbi:MAG: hypothetical protein JST00_39380 [Deltaproteobacteria bacterium]|nr:hypothetical protein [Deltaproteobacteria bacterium]
MAENPRPPVAIRIVRPYDTEDQLLENELETIGKTNVILIGAHPRPTGVILRFEVTLQSGATVLRGEGRVLAHKENAFRGQAGLSLRFTRLDPRSKAVVDRATAMREAKAPSRPPAAPMSDPAIADALTASTPEPTAATAAAPPAVTPKGADSSPSVAPARGSVSPPAEPPAESPASRLPPQPPAVIADEARARARAAANAQARLNATRTRPASDPAGLTPPPVPASEASSDAEVEAAHEDPGPPPAPATHVIEAPGLSAEDAEPEPPPEPTPVTSIPGEVAPRPYHVQSTRNDVGDDDGSDEATTLPPPRATTSAAAPVAAPAGPRASSPVALEGSARKVDPPADRAALLARLRDRAGNLAPQRVAEILGARR